MTKETRYYLEENEIKSLEKILDIKCVTDRCCECPLSLKTVYNECACVKSVIQDVLRCDQCK